MTAVAELTRSDIADRVRGVVGRMGIARAGFAMAIIDSDRIAEDLGIVGWERVEMISALELAFRIDLPGRDDCATVADLVEFVSHAINRRNINGTEKEATACAQ